MARIRTIKPEFFTSEDIVSLTPLSRLFYVSLWCESDRDGRLEWKPKTFKLRYFPADDCNIDAMGKELIAAGLIVLYEDGKFAEIPSFQKHQVINNRESESQIPARVKDASARDQAEGRKEGKERKARESRLPVGFAVSDRVKAWASEKGHDKLDKHLEHFAGYAKAKGATYTDWDEAFMNAIRNNWAKLPLAPTTSAWAGAK